MITRRTTVVSLSVAAFAVVGAQLGAGHAAAAPAASTSPSLTADVPEVATAASGGGYTVNFSTTLTDPTSTAYSGGTLSLVLDGGSRVNAADLSLTATTGGTATPVSLSNDDGDDVDADGAIAGYSVAANGSTSTSFALTIKPDASDPVRGQIYVFLEYDDSSGNTVADDYAAVGAYQDSFQIPKPTPYKVPQYVAVSRPSATNGVNDVYYTGSATGGAGIEVNAGGLKGDKVLVGDFFGSGDDYPIVYRPSTSTFYIADQFSLVNGMVTATGYESVRWGTAGDVPLVGAFPESYGSKPDAGSTDTVAIWRPSNQSFYIYGASGTVRWGQKTDIPVEGCWDGAKSGTDEGCDSVGVFRPSTHTFYLLTLADKTIPRQFGQNGDQPVVGDWNGSGTSLIGVDQNGRIYEASNNTNGAAGAPIQWGRATDVPLASFSYTPADLQALGQAAAEEGSVRTAKAIADAQPVHPTITAWAGPGTPRAAS